jgi:hypothetical protein
MKLHETSQTGAAGPASATWPTIRRNPVLPTLDQTLPTDQLRITPWLDPVVDLVGHDLRSPYVERFWLPILGPTTTFLLRRIAVSFDEHPDGFDLPLLDTAGALGLGTKGGRNAPFLRAIERAGTFKISRSVGPGALEVRRRLAPITRAQLNRLPAPLQDEHTAWQAQELRTPDLETQRRRARRLALSLAELGEDDEAIETQLHRWKLHPALAHEALRWARSRQQGLPIPPPPPLPGSAAAGRTAVFAPGDAA